MVKKPNSKKNQQRVILIFIISLICYSSSQNILKQNTYKEYPNTEGSTFIKGFSLTGYGLILTTNGATSTLYHEARGTRLTTKTEINEPVTDMARDLMESHFYISTINGNILVINKYSGVPYKNITTVLPETPENLKKLLRLEELETELELVF